MVTVALSRPIEHDGETYSQLTFREPTLGDLIAGETVGGPSRTAAVAATLAAMAEIPYPAFKKMSARDFAKVDKATAALVGNGGGGGTN